MFKKGVHGMALTCKAFMGFLTLWTFLMEAFWSCEIFWPQRGPRTSHVGWAKLTTLLLTLINMYRYMAHTNTFSLIIGSTLRNTEGC